jgi:hypothetical protein
MAAIDDGADYQLRFLAVTDYDDGFATQLWDTAESGAGTKTVTDSIGITETVDPVVIIPPLPDPGPGDTIGVTDQTVLGFGRAPADPVGITDTVTTELVGGDQTLAVATVVGNAIPLGPDSISSPDPLVPPNPYVPNVTAVLVAANGSTVLSQLTDAFGLEWRDGLNEAGFGKISVMLDDPDAALLRPGRFVRCSLHGAARFTWVIEGEPEIVRRTDGEESAYVVTASGRGWVASLSKTLVYPEKGMLNPLNPQHRNFTFASIDFPNLSGWQNTLDVQGLADDLIGARVIWQTSTQPFRFGLAAGNATTPSGWTSAPNGAINLLSAINDSTFAYDSSNGGGVTTVNQGYILSDTPADFEKMKSLVIQLRYGWGSSFDDGGGNRRAWQELSARVVRVSNGAILAARDSTGTFQRCHTNNITTVGAVTGPAVSFSYVNPEATKAAWDDARLELRIVSQAFGSGSTAQRRVYAGTVAGVYDVTDPPQPAPDGFPDPDAAWVWPTVNSSIVGRCYFRRSFTLTEQTLVVIAASADNYYTVFLDGVPIFGEAENEQCWAEYKQIEITLQAGTYHLAAVVENIPWPPQYLNPAGFICTVFQAAANLELIRPIMRTEATGWTALAYPTLEPGWTPGQIVRKCVDEAQARDVVLPLTLGFSAFSDSAGNGWASNDTEAWTFVPAFSIQVGATVLDVLDALVGENWIDYRMRPGTMTLDVWNANQGGVTTSVAFQENVNIRELRFEPTDSKVNRVIIKFPGGYVTVQNNADVAANGAFEAFLTVDSADIADARRKGRNVLNELLDPQSAIVVDYEPVTVASRPYTGFRVGDRVTCPNKDGTPTSYRVISIEVVQDEMGDPTYRIELNRRSRFLEREDYELLQTIGRGLVGERKVRVMNGATASSVAVRLGVAG